MDLGVNKPKIEPALLAELRHRWDGLEGERLIEAARKEFGDKLAMTCAFGSESVVELHMVSQVDPSIKIVFLETGKLFGETLRYRDLLQERLGLTNILSVPPDPQDKANLDPKGTLWSSDPDMCCHFRKVLPQEKALVGVEALITGRKRFQTQARKHMPLIDFAPKPNTPFSEGNPFRWSINPLASMTYAQIQLYMRHNRLPRHPLVHEGFVSIGCMPCTDRATAENYRAGRWVGRAKEECGIHNEDFVDGAGI